jgi:membrane-associated PAP2 superfamily phosphatase
MSAGPARPARGDLITAVLAGALLLLWDASGLDLPVARLFASAQGFAWRDHWFTRTLLHEGGRMLSWSVLLLLIVNLRWPLLWRLPLPLPLRTRVWWLLATLLCALLVPSIKQFSATSCPWDLAEFGGKARYVSHWWWGVADGGGGRCFPSGHATAAFAFLSGYFALRAHQPLAARAWLAAVLLLGLAFGWGQLARGAHYPSHTLWSGWLCWVLCSAAHALARPWLQPDQKGVSV